MNEKSTGARSLPTLMPSILPDLVATKAHVRAVGPYEFRAA